MKILKDIKSKKDLLKELKFYKQFILKKLESEDLNSALNKSRSALTLIKEYQEKFDLEESLKDFLDLNNKITTELTDQRNFYVKRLETLLNEKVDEITLENLMKLLAMLKSKVDRVYLKYNLEDVQSDINRYFSFIKRLYVIFSSYSTLNYNTISENIYDFKKDLQTEKFPNLSDLIEVINLKVILKKLNDLAVSYDRISLLKLSEEMQLNQDDLLDIIVSVLELPECPIKVYNSTNQEVIFNKD